MPCTDVAVMTDKIHEITKAPGETDAQLKQRMLKQISDAKQTPLFEPCARADGGINILRRGEPIWESSFSDPDDIVNGKYSNEEKWMDALLLCDALALIEKAQSQ